LEYAHRLKELSDSFQDKLKIVMRVYTGKPRTISSDEHRKWYQTSGEFWTHEWMNKWLAAARSLMLQITKLGLPIADEVLYTDTIAHFDDILSYWALGARSAEDQQHREVCSWLDFPIWVKNPTTGDVWILVNSLRSVSSPNHLHYNWYEAKSSGNIWAHYILRWYQDSQRICYQNFDPSTVEKIETKLQELKLNQRFIVDLNHDNSSRDWLNQPENLKKLLSYKYKNLAGIMVESYLQDGKQSDTTPLDKIVQGCSLTDSCLGREKTKALLEAHYQAI
jgi:3-deoxy-7-phosphoheptulonate synthase